MIFMYFHVIDFQPIDPLGSNNLISIKINYCELHVVSFPCSEWDSPATGVFVKWGYWPVSASCWAGWSFWHMDRWHQLHLSMLPWKCEHTEFRLLRTLRTILYCWQGSIVALSKFTASCQFCGGKKTLTIIIIQYLRVKLIWMWNPCVQSCVPILE